VHEIQGRLSSKSLLSVSCIVHIDILNILVFQSKYTYRIPDGADGHGEVNTRAFLWCHHSTQAIGSSRTNCGTAAEPARSAVRRHHCHTRHLYDQQLAAITARSTLGEHGGSTSNMDEFYTKSNAATRYRNHSLLTHHHNGHYRQICVEDSPQAARMGRCYGIMRICMLPHKSQRN
jgi:hypothetical protein